MLGRPTTLRRSVLAATAAAALAASFAIAPAEADHVREGDVRFKVTCDYSHSLPDDPIVFPNTPGASHLHDFIGRHEVSASTTTYTKLVPANFRAATSPRLTTCNDLEDLASYWAPALYADGVKINPSGMTAYYRRGNKHGAIKPFPDGLKMISDSGGWQCEETVVPGPTACSVELKMRVDFPDCWDGVNLDSVDHRSHMAYSTDTGAANTCPATHPVPVPRLTTYYNYHPPVGVKGFKLASGPAAGRRSTVHGDFFNGWVRARLIERIETCLNGLQLCDSGG